MRMDKLTSKFQLALQDAQSLALGRDHQFIEPIHLMIALLDQEGGSTRGLLTKADVNVNQLRSKLGEAVERLASVSGGDAGSVHVSNDLSKLLNVTDKIAQQRKDQYMQQVQGHHGPGSHTEHLQVAPVCGVLHQQVFSGPAPQRIGKEHGFRSFGSALHRHYMEQCMVSSPIRHAGLVQEVFCVCTIFMADPISAETSVILLGTMRVVVASAATLP